jgi:hypothetical protein
MSEPVALFSTADLSVVNFAELLTSVHGSLNADSDRKGRVSRDKRHVWLYFQSEDLTTLPDDMAKEIVPVLGGVPKTNIVLEVSREPGSLKVAFDIARAFATRWPAVLHDLEVPGRIYTRDELLAPVKL